LAILEGKPAHNRHVPLRLIAESMRPRVSVARSGPPSIPVVTVVSAIQVWLKGQDRPASWLGKQIGLGPTRAADIVAGRKRPTLAQKLAIEHVTGGEVPATAWVAT